MPGAPRDGAPRHATPTVDVWVVAPGAADPEPLLATLDAVERARAAALPTDQASRFVFARALLREVVGARLGCPAGEVVVRARCAACGGPHGQVEVVVRDAGAPAPHVSLTRAGPLIAVAVSDAGRVGVDVESPAAVAAARLADVALSPGEAAAHAGRPSADQATALARTWVRTEATLKALGTGLRIDPALVDTRGRTARLPAGTAGSPVELADLRLGPGAVGAVALQRAPRARGWPELRGGRRRLTVVLHDGDLRSAIDPHRANHPR
ncbi:4'-phosphopantetheinyl transferase family protein [Pengzhenrongella sicca]|uniref:4'-phosphopantetheinyl transferase superfamily protein n=1 Tax=Pengzhenrongella sicca TaxID=2819238 RepID=A0A8A4ZKX1_9MICO|nr:4'-phosphopantetheinyl transferase superfamily protein [Pengzhenrongella sicca]QTE31156.1 4'-phosphopantetheinyl transferase superfamily protein [Pengzhenrongella sicca]